MNRGIILKDLLADAEFYVRTRRPAAAASAPSLWVAILSSPGLWCLAAHRSAHAAFEERQAGRKHRRCLWVASHMLRWLARVVSKSRILPSTRFEAPVRLSNLGHIIIGARSIGAGTVIHDRVTLGRCLADQSIPAIGGRVWIGHDSLVIGGVTIGDGVTILPGTVLTKNLPPNVMVGGNPARVIRLEYDNSQVRLGNDRDPEWPADPSA